MLILVIVIFAILWLPIHIHLILMSFDAVSTSAAYDLISPLWNCLAYFNSCVNPIIYNHTSKEFRDAFREVARCRGGWRAGVPVAAGGAAEGAGRRESDRVAGRGGGSARVDGNNATMLVHLLPASEEPTKSPDGSRRCSAVLGQNGNGQ